MAHRHSGGNLVTDPGTGATATNAQLGLALVATFGRFKQEVGPRLAALGLSPLQARSLRQLDDPMTMRELAEAIGTEPSNLTPVVDRLEAAGLLRRRPRAGDRRVRELCLTSTGTCTRERLEAEVYGKVAIFDCLTEAQQSQLLGLLDRLTAG